MPVFMRFRHVATTMSSRMESERQAVPASRRDPPPYEAIVAAALRSDRQ